MAFHVEIPDTGYFRQQVKCQAACPVGTDARGYVRAIAAGDYEKAYLIARGPNPLASICGRVCGAPCEAACRRSGLDAAVSIRALKRFVTERFGVESGRFEPLEILQRVLESDDATHDCIGEEELRSLFAELEILRAGPRFDDVAKRVAIIGAGPAGLACAHDLALLGIPSTVFETEDEPAGMLIYGIPEYRLPRDLIRGEVAVIRALGVEFRCNTRVGVDVGFDDLLRDFAAVVIAVGAKSSRRIPLPGMDGPGVLGGVEFLRDVSRSAPLPQLGRDVVVIGGGNVAYDVARTVVRQIGLDVSRTALRQPDVASVVLASLESIDEMPADDVEILEGEEEGIRRLHRVGPVAIERNTEGRVTGLVVKRCRRVFDESGRFAPLFDETTRTVVPCDTVILAIGQTMDLSFVDPARDGVRLTERGFLANDPETLATSHPDVFVAGDVAYGPKLLIHAVASGKKAARSVYQRLTGRDAVPSIAGSHTVIGGYSREADYEKLPRQRVATRPPAERLRAQSVQVELGFQEAQVRHEAARCFDCGVNPIFDGERCVLCGGCVEVCPESCLKIVSWDRLAGDPALDALRREIGGDGDLSAILKDEALCIRCGLCAERCPNAAITMERFCFGGTSA